MNSFGPQSKGISTTDYADITDRKDKNPIRDIRVIRGKSSSAVLPAVVRDAFPGKLGFLKVH
ncbi:MAG: hypothetical protein ACI8V5_001357 [Limisphaerales bacterium]|jgi:hypothetical protein